MATKPFLLDNFKQHYSKNIIVRTGIGSLPFISTEEAIKYSLKHELPFLPELYQKGEDFHFLSTEMNSCFMPFLEAILETKQAYFKLQLPGPFSGHQNPKVTIELINTYLKIFNHHKKDRQCIPIIFLDEPRMNVRIDSNHNIYSQLLSVVDGIHCCNQFNLDQEFKNKNFSFISLDLKMHEKLLSESENDPSDQLIINGINAPKQTNSKWRSYSCGLGLKTIAECEDIFSMLGL